MYEDSVGVYPSPRVALRVHTDPELMDCGHSVAARAAETHALPYGGVVGATFCLECGRVGPRTLTELEARQRAQNLFWALSAAIAAQH